MIKYREHNNYDTRAASDEARVIIPEGEVSLTIQSQAEEADINVLMARYGLTGKMPENPRAPLYGDFSEVLDYRSALDAINKAEESFMALPANVRARFENDPQLLMEFVYNDANREEAAKLGLLKVMQPVAPMKVEVINPAPPEKAETPPKG